MSRYTITSPTNDNIFAVVGWDNSLETFFLQVYSVMDEDVYSSLINSDFDSDDILIYYIGEFSKEIPDISALNIECQNYNFILSPAVQTKLARDFDNKTEPSTLQKFARSFI